MIRMAEVAEEGPVVSGCGVRGFVGKVEQGERRTCLHAIVFDIFALFFVILGYSWGNAAAGLRVFRRVYGRQGNGISGDLPRFVALTW